MLQLKEPVNKFRFPVFVHVSQCNDTARSCLSTPQQRMQEMQHAGGRATHGQERLAPLRDSCRTGACLTAALP